MINEWATLKIASGVGGAVGAFAAIVAKKDVSKLEAYAIALVGIGLAFFVPSLIARYLIIKYHLTNDWDTIFGLCGLFGLIFGHIGFRIIGGISKIGNMFENNPIPFIQKLLGVFGKDK